MKGFLIFLAIAFPVVLASPFFWSLVNMNFGAERIGYVHQTVGGGTVTQWATLGPKAPWPSWALVPAGAKLTVRSNFEAAPGHNALGMADIYGKTAPRETVQLFQAGLRRGGWAVRVGRIDARSPDIPPQPIHMCVVEGRRGAQLQRLSVDIDDAQTTGTLWWTVGPAAFPIGAKDEPCWTLTGK
jgi:hypothetical protein